MTYSIDFDANIELEEELSMSTAALIQAIVGNPAVLAAMEAANRKQSMKSARRLGNTSGKWAQRQLPQAVINQNPATKRVF